MLQDLPNYNLCQYTLTRRGWELTKSVNQLEPVLMLSLICDQVLFVFVFVNQLEPVLMLSLICD